MVQNNGFQQIYREIHIPMAPGGLVVPRFYCSRHMHGNFVMQKVIQMLPPNSLGFMIYELKEGGWMWLICGNQLKLLLYHLYLKVIAKVWNGI